MPDLSETPARSTSLNISHFSEDEVLMMVLGLMSCEPGIQEVRELSLRFASIVLTRLDGLQHLC